MGSVKPTHEVATQKPALQNTSQRQHKYTQNACKLIVKYSAGSKKNFFKPENLAAFLDSKIALLIISIFTYHPSCTWYINTWYPWIKYMENSIRRM